MGQNIDNTFNLKCSTKVMENEKAGSHFWQKDRHSIEIKGQSNSWRVKRQHPFRIRRSRKNFKEGWDLTKFTDKKQSFLSLCLWPFDNQCRPFSFVDLYFCPPFPKRFVWTKILTIDKATFYNARLATYICIEVHSFEKKMGWPSSSFDNQCYDKSVFVIHSNLTLVPASNREEYYYFRELFS